MKPTMRAKMQVTKVTNLPADHTPANLREIVYFEPVSRSDGYPSSGLDEDNTYARWTPGGECWLSVANPALFGKFKVGDKFYVDFSPAT